MIPPDRGGEAPPPAEPTALDAPAADPSESADVPGPRPGTSTFTIEGRAAPALFVVGWLASLMGLGLLVVSFQSAAGPPQLILLMVGLALLSIGLVAGAGSQGIERRSRGVQPYQGPSPLIVFAAVIPIASLAIVVAAAPVSFLGFDVDSPAFRLLSVVVQALLYVALIRLLVVDTGALSWAEMGIRRPSGSLLRELAAGAVWALPVIALTVPISALLVGLFDAVPPSPLPPTGETAGFLVQLVAGAVIAPLGEELFFRAFATTAWARSLGAGTAIVRGGLFFAFVHVLTIAGTSLGEAAALALIGFATRVPIGLVLGWLFVRRGTIWAPIGLHATFNALLLIAAEAAIRSGAGAGPA